MLIRGGEVVLVRRSPRLRAFAGLWAFPGGTLSSGDLEVPVRGAAGPREAVRLAAAVREILEETGVFLARPGGGGGGSGGRGASAGALDRWRTRLLAGEASLAEVLAATGAAIHASDFAPVEELVTPRSAPFRFATRFYRTALPEGAEVSVRPGEIVDAIRLPPAEALARWTAGEFPLAPPVIGLLERWHPDDAVFRARNRAAARTEPVIRYSPGVAVIPCRTPTLPPAKFTNAALVGERIRYLVDPAATDEGERASLFSQVDRALGSADRIAGILVTHHHRDHIGSVAAAARRYDAPVAAHPETLARIPDLPERVRPLHGGEELPLGRAPDGAPDWKLQVRFTPGHTAGHLVFVESRYGAVMAGDLVSSISSILISPEDGDLGLYLESLRRLARNCRGPVIPGHGVPVIAGRRLLEAQIRHREAREASLLEALSRVPEPLEALGLRVYPPSEVDAGGPIRRLALTALESGLLKLRREGRAVEVAGGWAAAPP